MVKRRKNPYAQLAIFPGKDYKRPIRAGSMTMEGHHAFEAARTRLAVYVGRKATTVSDADVIEYLVRGEMVTIDYLKRTFQFAEE